MNEFDLTQILKDCPEGTKLYSPLFGDVTFNGIDSEDLYPISIIEKEGDSQEFTESGLYYHEYDGECMLFPSRDQRDWSKFVVSKTPNRPKAKEDFPEVTFANSPIEVELRINDNGKKVIDLRECKEDVKILLPSKYERMLIKNDDIISVRRYKAKEISIDIKLDPFALVPKSEEDFMMNFNHNHWNMLIKALCDSGCVANQEDKEATYSLIKLRLIWHEWVEVLGKPNYGGEEDYNYITWSCVHNSPVIAKSELKTYRSLAFIKYEHAHKFIECFGELLEKAKILL